MVVDERGGAGSGSSTPDVSIAAVSRMTASGVSSTVDGSGTRVVAVGTHSPAGHGYLTVLYFHRGDYAASMVHYIKARDIEYACVFHMLCVVLLVRCAVWQANI